jgi:hypothetical protein
VIYDLWVDDSGVCYHDTIALHSLDYCTNSSTEAFMLDGSAVAFHSVSNGVAIQSRIVPSNTITATATVRITSSSIKKPFSNTNNITS